MKRTVTVQDQGVGVKEMEEGRELNSHIRVLLARCMRNYLWNPLTIHLDIRVGAALSLRATI